MKKKIDWNAKKKSWISLVAGLCRSIKSWCEEKGWHVEEHEKHITEDHIGSYVVPSLFIASPQGRIHIDPVGRNIIGADGRVDIYAYPSFNRLLLVRISNKWKVETDSRIDWPEAWGKHTFIKIVNALTSTL